MTVAFVFSNCILAPANMKMHLLLSSLLIMGAALPVSEACADPILPYQQPIEQQLTNDLAMGSGDANTLTKALDTYHRTSKSLSSDIGILRDLDNLLAETPNYPALLTNAANDYLNDFEIRRDALVEQLRPAPISTTKTSAQKMLDKITAALSNAENATVLSKRIAYLQTAATKIPPTSNTIQRALRTKVGLSVMKAKVGVLKFKSTRGGITGGTFQTEVGNAIGDFVGSNGVLTISGFDNGAIARGIHLHVEGISSNTPSTYPLGVGENSAFYDATEVSKRHEYHFAADPALTNGFAAGASMTIDFISTNYVLGRFSFIGTNIADCCDTNTTASIHQGEFQVNFHH
jgi:hypothetical protein